MIKVNVYNNFNKLKYKPLFKKISKVITKEENIRDKRVINVIISDNDFIHDYNSRFRNVDRETDVLSFPSDEDGELGDVIISYEKALEQASDYGHSIEREMGFLFTHACLHCLGYDHMNEEEEKIMFDKQEKILDKVNLRRQK